MDKSEVVEDGNLFTSRLKVPGGWIYRSYDKSSGIMGMCFVPEMPCSTKEITITNAPTTKPLNFT